MNNKGFTLIEIIVTIALLSIIVMISFVSITSVIKSNKSDQFENLISSIKSSSLEYVSDNRYSDDLLVEGGYARFTASLLVNNNYLSGPISNPCTGSSVDPSNINITVRLNDNYNVTDVSVEGITCE